MSEHGNSKFKEEYCEQARKLCLLGHTDKDLAKYFEVSEATINNWKNDFPQFLESVKNGKCYADANIAEKLYHRAMGYEHQEVKVFCSEGVVTEHEVIKHYAPDPTAAMFWLKNRNPSLWRDRKATLPTVTFDFDKNASVSEQASQILSAAAGGVISPDVANVLIGSIAAMMKIEEVTELKSQLEEIKKILGVSDE